MDINKEKSSIICLHIPVYFKMRGHVYVLGVSILPLITILLLGVGQRTVQSVWWVFSLHFIVNLSVKFVE
jgi:hypothetical protein